MTTATEIDPNLLKALEYFRSNSLDSAEKLKMMLDDAIESTKRWQDSKELFSKSGKLSHKSVKGTGINVDKKKENNASMKRSHEKIQRDTDDILQETSKKTHVENFTSLGSNSTLAPNVHIPPKHSSSPAPDIMSPSNGAFRKSPLSSTVADDFELEMADLACAICNNMAVGLGNQLVECQECHNLYHRDCHQPPISDKEVNDPRCIWYCVKCKQHLKKQSLIHSPHPSSLGNSLDPFREKSIEVKDKVHITPFKRSEMKPTISTASNSAASLSGWAALSGKPIPSTPKDIVPKTPEAKQESLIHRTLSGSKEKSKSKNHVKNSQSKFVVSDAWAEALGAKSTSTEKVKPLSNKTSANSGGSKQIQLSSGAWLSPGSNSSSKHKSSDVLSPKSAPFPKASAATSPIAKSASTHDNAARQMQMMKKKAAAKIQQKRTRV